MISRRVQQVHGPCTPQPLPAQLKVCIKPQLLQGTSINISVSCKQVAGPAVGLQYVIGALCERPRLLDDAF